MVKRRKWEIILVLAAMVIAFTYLRKPVIVGDCNKQTAYLWFLNLWHCQIKDAKPRILLIDDDSGNGIYAIKQLCDELQMKAVFAIIPSKMNKDNIDSIKSWQEIGYEIALHGYSHDDWRSWTYDEVINDIVKCEKWLQQHHLDEKAIQYIVAPHGSNTNAVRNAIKYKGYQMVTGANILNPDTEVELLGRVMITKDTDLEETKMWLKEAKEKKLFVILGTHSSMPDEFSEEKTKAVLQMAIDMGFEYKH